MPAAEAMARRVERWLFAPGDPRRLAAVRIGLCGLLAVRLAGGPYAELATQPAALFRPISFLRLLDRMPSPEAVAALQALALAAAVLATVGLLTRVTLPVAWLAALPRQRQAAVCQAWAEAVRDRGGEVAEVRIYQTLTDVSRRVGDRGAPPVRTLRFTYRAGTVHAGG